MEFKKISRYDIKIRHTINGGVIVKVGCAELSFGNYKMMLEAMKQYYEDPEGMEKLYNHSGANEDVPQEVASQPEECTERGAVRHRGTLGPRISTREGVDDAFSEEDQNF